MSAGNATPGKQSRKLLQCMEETFQTQLVSEPATEGSQLDLLFLKDWWMM